MTSYILRNRLAVNLRTARKRKRYSQAELAARAGLSCQMIADIEECRKWPSDKTFTRIATSLDSDVYLLLKPLDQKIICTNNPKLFWAVVQKLQQAVNTVLESMIKR